MRTAEHLADLMIQLAQRRKVLRNIYLHLCSL